MHKHMQAPACILLISLALLMCMYSVDASCIPTVLEGEGGGNVESSFMSPQAPLLIMSSKICGWKTTVTYSAWQPMLKPIMYSTQPRCYLKCICRLISQHVASMCTCAGDKQLIMHSCVCKGAELVLQA